MAGLLGSKFKTWMTPDRAISMQAIGTALQGLGSGQPVNLAPAYQALQQRKRDAAFKDRLNGGEFAGMFTPEQMSALSTMPSSMAQEIITKRMFAPPQQPKYQEINGELVRINTDGSVESVYGSPNPPTDSRTSAMKEYEYAVRQGYKGTFEQFQTDLKKAGRTSVNG